MAAEKSIVDTVVVGSGVIGLSTAIRAQEAGRTVAIVASLFPTDPKSIHYTSCWAGAHHVSVATVDDVRQQALDMSTFKYMEELLQKDDKVPLMMRPQLEYRESEREIADGDGADQFTLLEKFSPNFRMLRKEELLKGITHGASFDTIMIDSPNYLLYLLKTFTSRGGTTIRASLESLHSIFSFPELSQANIVINCSGMGARSLVNDHNVYPTRGQTVLVRAPWVQFGVTRTGPQGSGVYTYVIPRKSGDVILGGTANQDDWEPNPRPETSRLIKERCLALCPELLSENKRSTLNINDLDVIEEGCGWRPTRRGGIRLDAEILKINDQKVVHVIHNYGHGGYGYQSSWGSADEAIHLVNSALA